VYVGELYYQAHRGTYTSQARTKQGNRRSEFALREAELWAAAAAALKGYRIPRAALESAWRDVLLNQFHDILPGSSIHRVYEEAEARHAEALRVAREVADAARRRLLRRRPGAVTAFNSLGWERTALVPLPDGMRGAAAGGAPLPAQRIGGAVCVEATLPPCGWVTLDAADRRPRTANLLRAGASLLENECLRLRFNARGEITSCLDKETGWEWARGPLNALRMYKDVPRWFDAWDLDSTYEFQPVDLDEPAAIRVTARGPLLAALRLRRRIHRSVILQEIRLRRGSRCVEFRTVVDWREKHKLLKVSFPTAIHANEALHEIQFGHLARPNHRSRPFDADRFEVCNHKWTAVVEAGRGAAVLNDCKYGVDVDGGSINLTLLRSPQAPDMTADLGRQEFTYAFYPWNGSFAGTDMIRAAYEINVPAAAMAGAGGAASLLSVDAANIVIETVKPAEDHRGDVVVRLYECKRMATRCTLATRLPAGAACETDMLEQGARPVRVRNGRVRLEFRPFEIKTLRLKR
jgi:alpha-mannosidase